MYSSRRLRPLSPAGLERSSIIPSPPPGSQENSDDDTDCGPLSGEHIFVMFSVPLKGQHWLPCHSRIPGQGWGPHSAGRDLCAEPPSPPLPGWEETRLLSARTSLQLTQVNRQEGRVPRKRSVYGLGALMCGGPHLCTGCGLTIPSSPSGRGHSWACMKGHSDWVTRSAYIMGSPNQ